MLGASTAHEWFGPPECHEWKFPLRSCRVYDGDTLMDMVLDLGFGITIKVSGRLDGINAPEVRGVEKEQGVVSRDWLRSRMMDAENVVIVTRPSGDRQQGKYGRWLITVVADGHDLNEMMVQKKLARWAKYS